MISLPKIEHPIYRIKIPSIGKDHSFRPFLVKEEKLLLMAKESNNNNDIFISIKQVINNCSLDSNLNIDKASAVYALRLTGSAVTSFSPTPDSFITQTIGVGSTSVGRVLSYDNVTGVLKYWQDRTLAGFNTVGTAQTNPQYGYDLTRFTSSPTSGGNLTIVGGTVNLSISTSFSGFTTSINNKTYYLGQNFTNGLSNPEVKKYSGNIIYVDNRPAIRRSSSQKEDIKIILQF